MLPGKNVPPLEIGTRVSAAPLYAHERQSQRDCHDEERNTCAEFYFFLFRYAPSVYETYPEAFCYSREARAERYTSAVVKCCTPHKKNENSRFTVNRFIYFRHSIRDRLSGYAARQTVTHYSQHQAIPPRRHFSEVTN